MVFEPCEPKKELLRVEASVQRASAARRLIEPLWIQRNTSRHNEPVLDDRENVA